MTKYKCNVKMIKSLNVHNMFYTTIDLMAHDHIGACVLLVFFADTSISRYNSCETSFEKCLLQRKILFIKHDLFCV